MIITYPESANCLPECRRQYQVEHDRNRACQNHYWTHVTMVKNPFYTLSVTGIVPPPTAVRLAVDCWNRHGWQLPTESA